MIELERTTTVNRPMADVVAWLADFAHALGIGRTFRHLDDPGVRPATEHGLDQLRGPVGASVQHNADLDPDPVRDPSERGANAAQTGNDVGLFFVRRDHHGHCVDHRHHADSR